MATLTTYSVLKQAITLQEPLSSSHEATSNYIKAHYAHAVGQRFELHVDTKHGNSR
jgi:hypothetical protein